MSMPIQLPLGIDSFEKLQKEGYYYIDKTDFIARLLQDKFEVNLITRPRRFGKTLTMSMLEAFFDISRKDLSVFENLSIGKNAALCQQWQNQFPVVFLTLKSVEANTYEDAYELLKILISDVCKKYSCLESSSRIDSDDLSCFRKLKARQGSPAEIKDSLYLLMRMMYAHYGKPVILLIDEYDVPLASADENKYYKEMLDMIRGMLGKALKTNEFLKFSVITGCLKIAKESIFTGINHVVSDTISGSRFDEYLGFTEQDVDQLLRDSHLTGHAEEMKRWYNGYLFGHTPVYCPWDVLNHVAALQINPSAQPQNYWASTSHNSILYKIFDRTDFDVNTKFETLLSGGCLKEKITEDLTYDTIDSTEENLWSLLYATGYLTGSNPSEQPLHDGTVLLRIPNEEIKSLFKTAIVEQFKKSVQTLDRSDFFQAMWNGRTEAASAFISDLLFASISYYDYSESYYHAFLAGLFAGGGYMVESNFEYGNGRPDVVVKDRKKRRVIVLEAKYVKSSSQLEAACRSALLQIQEKRYSEPFQKEYRQILCYGVAFSGKDCLVMASDSISL